MDTDKKYCLAAALALCGLACPPLWAQGQLESDAQRLMGLGRSDALARRDEICAFFGWQDGGDPLRLVQYSTLSGT